MLIIIWGIFLQWSLFWELVLVLAFFHLSFSHIFILQIFIKCHQALGGGKVFINQCFLQCWKCFKPILFNIVATSHTCGYWTFEICLFMTEKLDFYFHLILTNLDYIQKLKWDYSIRQCNSKLLSFFLLRSMHKRF